MAQDAVFGLVFSTMSLCYKWLSRYKRSVAELRVLSLHVTYRLSTYITGFTASILDLSASTMPSGYCMNPCSSKSGF